MLASNYSILCFVKHSLQCFSRKCIFPGQCHNQVVLWVDLFDQARKVHVLEQWSRPFVHQEQLVQQGKDHGDLDKVASSLLASSSCIKSVKIKHVETTCIKLVNKKSWESTCIKPVDNLQQTCCHPAGASECERIKISGGWLPDNKPATDFL